jgi:hypothetical protein
VESLRRETQLYLPPLSKRRGFSSSRVEHLLNRLVQMMPADEAYLEVGTLEGRTLEAAASGNDGKQLYGVDPGDKYGMVPEPFTPNIVFYKSTWQSFLKETNLPMPVGCVFYDADHSAEQTADFMDRVEGFLAEEAVLVLDDWDRESVRLGAFRAGHHWTLLRECPEYTDGTGHQHHFGYAHGVGVWGYNRA